MFERGRVLKLNNALLLGNNEIGEINSLVSCHVCIIRIKSPTKEYIVMSHFRVTDVHEHISAIQSILYNRIGANYGPSPIAIVLLFRLSLVELVRKHASSGTIYHIEKYEAATKALKDALVRIFPNALIREIPYNSGGKDGCWITLNMRKGRWESSFGSGLIDELSVKIKTV